MKYLIKVYRWDLEFVRNPANKDKPLPLFKEATFEGSSDIDTARKEAERFGLALGGARVRGCSVLAGKEPGSVVGFSVTTEG